MSAQQRQPLNVAFDRLAVLATSRSATVELCRISRGEHAGAVVAVKRLPLTYTEDPDLLAMFRDEIWMASALAHPNVTRVLGWGEDHSGPFLVAEFVRGVSLARLMRTVFSTGEAFSERLIVYLASCICAGLGAAHALRADGGEFLNLVHRDLTPGNVLLSFDGDVKITDFGLAKAKQRATHTAIGMTKGEPAYMSPEQVCGQPLDGRSDIFMLGVLLFELFAQRRPWTVTTVKEALSEIVHGETPDLGAACPRIDRALATAVHACLAKKREDRYQTADDLKLRFDEWLRLHGYDDSRDHLARFVRRNAMRQMRWVDRAIDGEPGDMTGVSSPFDMSEISGEHLGSDDFVYSESPPPIARPLSVSARQLEPDPVPSHRAASDPPPRQVRTIDMSQADAGIEAEIHAERLARARKSSEQSGELKWELSVEQPVPVDPARTSNAQALRSDLPRASQPVPSSGVRSDEPAPPRSAEGGEADKRPAAITANSWPTQRSDADTTRLDRSHMGIEPPTVNVEDPLGRPPPSPRGIDEPEALTMRRERASTITVTAVPRVRARDEAPPFGAVGEHSVLDVRLGQIGQVDPRQTIAVEGEPSTRPRSALSIDQMKRSAAGLAESAREHAEQARSAADAARWAASEAEVAARQAHAAAARADRAAEAADGARAAVERAIAGDHRGAAEALARALDHAAKDPELPSRSQGSTR